MQERTNQPYVLDVINTLGEHDAADVIFDVQVDEVSALAVQAGGTVKAGTNYLTHSLTIENILTLSQLAYDQTVEKDPNTLYIIVPVP